MKCTYHKMMKDTKKKLFIIINQIINKLLFHTKLRVLNIQILQKHLNHIYRHHHPHQIYFVSQKLSLVKYQLEFNVTTVMIKQINYNFIKFNLKLILL
uniref:SJCHGC09744 protein n=1 Tax=Schistosoma japonicum TaxID=6182 RepID=Q5BQZ9_SCHJA|nr:SJCHGC09744 protein [Schistosoma japonicum]